MGLASSSAKIGKASTNAKAQDIGARWELVTEKLDGVQTILHHMAHLTDLVDQLRGPIADEFRERHAEHAELRSVKLANEQTWARLKETENYAQSLLDRITDAEIALAESKQQRASLEAERDARLYEFEQMKIERADSRMRATELAAALDEALLRSKQLAEDVTTLREQVDDTDLRRRESETNASRLQRELYLAQEEIAVLRSHLDQSDAEVSKLGRALTEQEDLVKAGRAKINELEQITRTSQAESLEAARNAEAQAETYRTTLNALTARSETAHARALKLDELNGELSRALNDALAKKHQSDIAIAEVRVTAQRAEERARATEQALTAVRRDFSSVELARSTAVERADDLAQSLKARDAALKRAEERATELCVKLEAAQSDHVQKRAVLEERLDIVETQLEREVVERSIIEGSLQTARSDRARLQGALLGPRAGWELGDELTPEVEGNWTAHRREGSPRSAALRNSFGDSSARPA